MDATLRTDDSYTVNNILTQRRRKTGGFRLFNDLPYLDMASHSARYLAPQTVTQT